MKIAISVPDEIFEAGERLAKQLGLSRSQLYADALSAYFSERGAAAVRPSSMPSTLKNRRNSTRCSRNLS
jgi:metal-responsive CopG/Arc/MetJ family transcriptional regulator